MGSCAVKKLATGVEMSRLPYVKTVIKPNIICFALLDTGSEKAVISNNFCLKNNLNLQKDSLTARGFNSNPVESQHSVILSFSIGNIQFSNVKFHVFNNLNSDMILPSGLFETVEIRNFAYNPAVILNGQNIQAHFNENFLIRAPSDILVPPESQKILTLKEGIEDLRYFVEPIRKSKNLELVPTFSQGRILMLVKNFNPFEVTIFQGEPIAQVEADFSVNALITVPDSPAEHERHQKHLKMRTEKFAISDQEIRPNFGDNVSETGKRKITALFNEYKVNFSLNKNDVGLLKNYRYKLNPASDAKFPWYQPGRKISEKAVDELSRVFTKELSLGLLEEGSSEFNIPLVLIRKKDGSIRCCLDLRLANQSLRVSKFPIPHLNSILSKISKEISEAKSKKEDARVFITMFDIRQAYRNLEIVPEDQEKLSFSFNGRQYRHTRMPFGLADAPACWSEIMTRIYSKIPNLFCYLDDICLVSVGENALFKDLEEVMKITANYGLVFNPEKCFIGQNKVDVLGFRVSTNGISLIPKKVEKLLALGTPKNKDQVRSVVSSFNFYRGHVPRLITILGPLYRLLQKNIKFSWSDLENKAFEDAKHAIANFTTLVHRNSEFPLVLVCDASNCGVGAVLYQKRPDGVLEPLGFFSKNLSPREQKGSIRDRELLSIYFAIKNWVDYFLCEPVIVSTDHRSLEFFLNTKYNFVNIRSRNIINFLLNFDIKICYIKGTDKLMLPSDLLSRAKNFRVDFEAESEAPEAILSENLSENMKEQESVLKPQVSEKADCDENDPPSPKDNWEFKINILKSSFKIPYKLADFEEGQKADEKISNLRNNLKDPYFIRDGVLYKKK